MEWYGTTNPIHVITLLRKQYDDDDDDDDSKLSVLLGIRFFFSSNFFIKSVDTAEKQSDMVIIIQ